MASFPYDVKLSISGGSEYGYMLVSPPGESKQLAIDEVPGPESQSALNRIETQDIQQRTDFDLRQDQVLAQGDLSGGVGDLEFGDGTTFWWGTAITHVPGKVYCPPPVNTEAFPSGANEWAGSSSYVTAAGTRYDFAWQSTRLYRRDASNTTNNWSLVYTAAFAITDFQVIDGAGYICTPSSSNASIDFLYQSDPTAAATWSPTSRNHTAFSVALGKPKYMRTLRGWVYAVVDNRKVFYSSDATTDGWLGPIDTSLENNTSGPPGDTSYAFTNAVAVNDFLFVFKQDAGYNIDSQQEVTEALWQWKGRAAADQFKYIATGGDLMYFSVSPEVYAYDPGTGRTTPLGLSRKSGFSIQDIAGVGADNQYTYVLAKVRVPTLRASASMALFRCWRTSASTWGYEVVWENTASTAYSGLFVSPQGTGSRVYWFETDGTDSLHMDVPADWDETTSGSYATSAVLYTNLWRTGFPNFIKRWLWVATLTEALDANNTIAIAYSVDQGATFTTLTTLTSAGLTFSNFSAINAQSLVLRFTFVCAGTATPVLRVYDLHGRPRWRYLPAVTAAVRIADYVEMSNGARSSDPATTLRANLETLRTSNGTITYEDFLGHSFAVSVDKIAYKPTRHETPEKSHNGRYELEAVITLARADSGA